MAIPAEKLKGRVKALYPNANLSTVRMSAIADRLCKKPKDDATDDEIDEVVKDFNDYGPMTFEEIAKADDTVRSLQTKTKTEVKEEVKKEEIKTDPDEPAWFKSYREANDAKLAKIETERTKETVSSKFANDKRVKGIPDFIKAGYIPSSDDEYEDKVTTLVEAYKPFAEKHKLEGFGNDIPPSSEDSSQSKGKAKPIDADMAKQIVS